METPFNMLIVGMTACGKTHYLLNTLESVYRGKFDYIVLICPTFKWNKAYQDWKYVREPDVLAIDCAQDNVDAVLKYVTNVFKGTNTLIVLDDCASGQDVKNRTSQLVSLAFSARHFGLSVMVVTQQLTSIAKPYRENISKLVCFYCPSKSDMKVVMDDYLGNINKEEISTIVAALKNHKYARLEILLRHPYSYEVVVPQ